MDVKFKVEGLKELDLALSQFDDEMQRKTVRDAMVGVLDPVKEAAKVTAPKDWGDLRSSIRTDVRRAPKKWRKKGRVATTSVLAGWRRRDRADAAGLKPGYYAVHVEYGQPDRGVAAQPFLKPAFERLAPMSISNLRRNLRRGVDKLVRELGNKTKGLK